MNKNSDKLNLTEKKSYAPPKLRVIELVTDEILGVGCKTVSDVTPSGLCGTTPCGNEVGS